MWLLHVADIVDASGVETNAVASQDPAAPANFTVVLDTFRWMEFEVKRGIVIEKTGDDSQQFVDIDGMCENVIKPV